MITSGAIPKHNDPVVTRNPDAFGSHSEKIPLSSAQFPAITEHYGKNTDPVRTSNRAQTVSEDNTVSIKNNDRIHQAYKYNKLCNKNASQTSLSWFKFLLL
jgi:hypothetical protein